MDGTWAQHQLRPRLVVHCSELGALILPTDELGEVGGQVVAEGLSSMATAPSGSGGQLCLN